MMRFMLTAFLTVAAIVGLAGVVLADSQETTSDSYPVAARLELRDRIVTITSATNGYLYSIADQSGSILSASLTEEQMAEQYPELHHLLRPAVADDGAELMMLTPVAN